MARVVVLGSSNTDMTVRLPRLPSPGQTLLGGAFFTGPGGKGANQAVAARRAGADVVFLTAVGDDHLGRQALKRYQGEGIDVSHVRIVPGVASGVALIFVDEAGENMIGVAPGANARLTPDDIDRLPPDLFTPDSVLLACLEVPRETVARAARRAHEAGMRVILNPAPADKALLDGLLRSVDILTPNATEAVILAGLEPGPENDLRAADALLDRGVPVVVLTRGASGCLVVDRRSGQSGEVRCPIPAFRVPVVDTVGAGDAFNGVLAVGLAEQRPLSEAALRANAAAALAVAQSGAQSALPSREAIDHLVATVVPESPPFA